MKIKTEITIELKGKTIILTRTEAKELIEALQNEVNIKEVCRPFVINPYLKDIFYRHVIPLTVGENVIPLTVGENVIPLTFN